MVRWYRSLFLRIFLWFWLIVFLSMATVAFSIQWLSDDYYRQARPNERLLLRRILETQRPIVAEERQLWRRLKPGWNLITVPLDSVSQLPHDMEEFADAAANRGQILWAQDGRWIMIGPVRRGSDLYLAVTRKAWQNILIEEDRWFIPLIILSIVTLLCFILAYGITKPINRLQRTVRRIGTGDFDTSALSKGLQRKDEMGVLMDDVVDMGSSLQRLLQSHQQLLRDVSHELRSPLTRLQIALGIARKKDTEGLLSKEHNRIEKSATQVEHLISQILDLARLQQQSKAKLQLEKGNLNQYIKQWLEDADLELEQKGLSLETQLANDIDMHLDWLLMERAFDNVLRNAIRFSPEGSQIMVKSHREQDLLYLMIQDQGVGVPDEKLPLIFDAFSQVDTARDHSTGGYGIGLALVKRIIELHQGSLTAENTDPGLKVTFQIKIM